MRHLVMPVETAARELDAKILLALCAARRGIAVTLGAKALVNLAIHTLPRGVYLPPNVNRTSDRIVEIARNLGYRVAGWDEEGLVWLNPASYRERRVSAAVCARLDLLFAWGDEHADALGPAVDGLPLDLFATGHPRADLLRPEFRDIYAGRAAAITAEYGDFVLINSNFGWINHLLAAEAAGGTRDFESLAEKSNFPAGYLRHRAAIYGALTAALPIIARHFPDRRFVVRPHPDEHHAGWLRAAEGCRNVVVRYDSELVPWLMAAGHIVQNGCTTAIEAALLGRAAISFRPMIDEPYEIPQPTAVGIDARTPDELIALLSDNGLADRASAHRSDALARRVASLDGPTASERIASALETLFEENGGSRVGPLTRIVGHVGALRRRVGKHAQRNDPLSSANPTYYSHKFPPISLDAMRVKVGEFADHLGMPRPEIRELSDRVFRFSAL